MSAYLHDHSQASAYTSRCISAPTSAHALHTHLHPRPHTAYTLHTQVLHVSTHTHLRPNEDVHPNNRYRRNESDDYESNNDAVRPVPVRKSADVSRVVCPSSCARVWTDGRRACVRASMHLCMRDLSAVVRGAAGTSQRLLLCSSICVAVPPVSGTRNPPGTTGCWLDVARLPTCLYTSLCHMSIQ